MYDGNPTPDVILSYRQRRTLQLVNLEAQLKLSTSPRGRLDLLSQVLMVQMDLRHLQEVNGKSITIV